MADDALRKAERAYKADPTYENYCHVNRLRRQIGMPRMPHCEFCNDRSYIIVRRHKFLPSCQHLFTKHDYSIDENTQCEDCGWKWVRPCPHCGEWGMYDFNTGDPVLIKEKGDEPYRIVRWDSRSPGRVLIRLISDSSQEAWVDINNLQIYIPLLDYYVSSV
jgi:hypothetical protein